MSHEKRGVHTSKALTLEKHGGDMVSGWTKVVVTYKLRVRSGRSWVCVHEWLVSERGVHIRGSAFSFACIAQGQELWFARHFHGNDRKAQIE